MILKLFLQVTYCHLVPPLVLFLAKEPRLPQFDFSTLKTIVCGAAPLGDGLTKDIEDTLSVNLFQGTNT